jgi:hypothetical protein
MTETEHDPAKEQGSPGRELGGQAVKTLHMERLGTVRWSRFPERKTGRPQQ